MYIHVYFSILICKARKISNSYPINLATRPRYRRGSQFSRLFLGVKRHIRASSTGIRSRVASYRLMEWWDRRAVCGFADRQSQPDWLGSRAVRGDHRKRPITAPHSRLPLSSRSNPGTSLYASPYCLSSDECDLSSINFLSSYVIILRGLIIRRH